MVHDEYYPRPEKDQRLRGQGGALQEPYGDELYTPVDQPEIDFADIHEYERLQGQEEALEGSYSDYRRSSVAVDVVDIDLAGISWEAGDYPEASELRYALECFGLADRYYWLIEDYERLQRRKRAAEWGEHSSAAVIDNLNSDLSNIRRTVERLVQSGKDGYSPYWETLSRFARSQADWKCTECGAQMRDRPDLLHVHHLNRNRRDNRPQNLRVLCALCHANQAAHGHLLRAVAPEDVALLEARRTETSTIKNGNRINHRPGSVSSVSEQQGRSGEWEVFSVELVSF
jgi:5-methylcytosine-specific restriction endonuclease McrA